MNADQVRALVQAKYPSAMQSPLATLFAGVAARDEADRAIGFATLQAQASAKQLKDMDHAAWRSEAEIHAIDCIHACIAAGVEWDEETLSHNIESNFPSFEIEECDEIAALAVADFRDSTA